MSMKQFRRVFLAMGIVGTVVMFVLIASAFISKPCANLLPTYALAELNVSALAFLAAWSALLFTIFLFLKAMAKPFIKVAFNEKGKQQATLTRQDGALSGQPQLWLINEGNAISRYFQIDFIIPENIGKQSRDVSIARRDGKYVVSNTNDGKYTLFVNSPRLDPSIIFWAAIDTKKCIKVDSFEIEYRIYGDWAETQEGKLKVNIHKQKE